MSKLLSFTFLFLIICEFHGFSQEQKQPDKSHYYSQKGSLFLHKELPVYFRISTSPDPKAKSYLLKNTKPDKYSNPIYLSNEGQNIFYTPSAVDTVTKEMIFPEQNINFEIYADGKAPETKAIFIGGNKFVNEGKTYYNANLVINLKSTDAVSGIKNIFVSTNNSDYIPSLGQISFNNTDLTDCVLKYYSIDNVGNMENAKIEEFTIDRTPPKSRFVLRGVQDGEKVLSSDSHIILKSDDPLSGVKAQYYSLDGAPFQLFFDKIGLGHLDQGEHSLKFYAVDNVNNDNKKEMLDQLDGDMINYFNFIIDKMGPVTDCIIEGDQYQGNYLFVSNRTKFEIKSADKESGTAFIYFGINEQPRANTFEDLFTLNDKQDGAYRISYTAMDNLKNVADAKYKTVFLDSKTPSTSIDYKYPQFFNRDTLFINLKTKVALYAKDNASGVKITEYSINDGPYLKYESEFTFPQGGFYKIKFRSKDFVNNEEVTKESQALVDDTPPEIYIGFSIKPIGSETKGLQQYPVYPTYTRMYLSATDKFSGTETIYYSIDGGPMRKYASSQSIADSNQFTKEKLYTVNIVARDKLGNESEKEVKFFIREK